MYRISGSKRNYQHEYYVQVAIVNYLRAKYPGALWTASSAGMKTNVITAMRFKAMGVQPGFPDIAIYEPRGIYRGLFIELKRPKARGSSRGTVSPHQTRWIDGLNRRGYKAVICYGFDDARKILDDYMKTVYAI